MFANNIWGKITPASTPNIIESDDDTDDSGDSDTDTSTRDANDDHDENDELNMSLAAMEDSIRTQIVNIYAVHNPEKLEHIDAILEQWRGDEEELLASIKEKYLPAELRPQAAGKDFHEADWSLWWGNVRANAEQRIAAWLAVNPSAVP